PQRTHADLLCQDGLLEHIVVQLVDGITGVRPVAGEIEGKLHVEVTGSFEVQYWRRAAAVENEICRQVTSRFLMSRGFACRCALRRAASIHTRSCRLRRLRRPVGHSAHEHLLTDFGASLPMRLLAARISSRTTASILGVFI